MCLKNKILNWVIIVEINSTLFGDCILYIYMCMCVCVTLWGHKAIQIACLKRYDRSFKKLFINKYLSLIRSDVTHLFFIRLRPIRSGKCTHTYTE